jgi:hypothetical protein
MSKKQSLPKRVKTECWDTWIGKDFAIAKCMCCEGVDIRNIEFDCGHVLAEANGGLPHAKNLRPVCASCNNSMGTEHMAIFKFKYGWGVLKGFTQDDVLLLIKTKNKPEVSQPELSQPEVSQPEVSQPEVSQPEVSQPELSQPEETNDCILWEKDLIKRVLPRLIQVPLKKYTGIDLTIPEEELFKHIREDLKGLYDEYGGNVFMRIDKR